MELDKLNSENELDYYENVGEILFNYYDLNSKILSLVSKWFIYRLVRNLFRTEPRRIAKFLKKFI